MIDRPITLAAARLVVTGQRSDTFQQSRFAAAVFANDDGDGVVEGEIEAARKIGRQNG
jgi:hypothetical protein